MSDHGTGSGDADADRPEGSGDADGDGDADADDPTEVGDGRLKHVTVVTATGEEIDHGDVYLKHSAEGFAVSPDADFDPAETTRYRKDHLRRVEVTQHHSACFITTAAAGAGDTLDALREFRDDVLVASPGGRALVATYEAVSPPVAATLARHPNARTTRAVRRLVERCGGLARRRADADGATAAALVALYVLGVCVAVGGHAVIRARERRERRDGGPRARSPAPTSVRRSDFDGRAPTAERERDGDRDVVDDSRTRRLT